MKWFGHSKDEMDYFERNMVKNCDTCEMNGPGVCMGPSQTYGKPIEETKELFPNGCEDWGISLDHYCDIMESFEKKDL